MPETTEDQEEFWLSWNPATTELAWLINNEIIKAQNHDAMGVYPGGGYPAYQKAREYYRGYIAGLEKAQALFHGQMGVIVKRRS
jgi:hypothetical protein